MKTSNTQLESNCIPLRHPHSRDLKSQSSLISVLTKAGQWVSIGRVFFLQLRAISIIRGISIHMKIMHSHSLLVQTTAQPISDHLVFSFLLFNPWLYLLSYPTTEQTKQENNCVKSKCIEALDKDVLPFLWEGTSKQTCLKPLNELLEPGNGQRILRRIICPSGVNGVYHKSSQHSAP